MQITQRGQERNWNRIISEMPFIPVASNWVKLLLSLLAEPLMFISTLVIIAVTVVPGATSWPIWIAATSKLIMSIGPEIVLPGCFTLAQIARRDRNRAKSNLLFGLCGVFTLLTLFTLASFVWNLSGVTGNAILFIRCAAGISYTVILHIHQAEAEPSGTSTVPTHEDLQQQIQKVLTPIIQQLSTDFQNQLAEIQNQNLHPQVNYDAILNVVLPHVRKTIIKELPNNLTPLEIPAPRRRAAPVPKTREERLENAYHSMLKEGKTPSGQALATLAKCSKKNALEWLKIQATETQTETLTPDPEPEQQEPTDGRTEENTGEIDE